MSDRRAVTTYRRIGTANTNAAVVKAAPADLHGVIASNVNAAVVYLKLYDKATTPTESDTPKLTLALMGGTVGPISGFAIEKPVKFETGLAMRLVGGVADNSTTAVSANEQVVHLLYL